MSEQTTNIVVLGAGYAGMLATLRLAATAKNAHLTLVNASDVFVERIRLHQATRAKAKPIAQLLQGKNVRFIQAWVKGIDPETRKVTVQTQNDIQHIHYDYLIYALGSTVDRDRVPGVSEHAYTLTPNGAKSAQALQEILPDAASRRQRLIVVGGGLTAIEAASEFAENYPQLQISLITSSRLGDHLSNKGRAHLQKVFSRLGVTIFENTNVQQIQANALLTSSHESIPFDICVWSSGFTVPSLARDSGLAVNDRGQILIDEYLRSTSHPEIYAAGDAAIFVDDLNLPVRMACATAEPMAAQAADNLAALVNHQPQQPFGFNYIFQCISLGRRDGLIQLVNPDDSPKEQIFTGWLAAVIKEMICRFAWWSVNIQRRWPQAYTWPGKNARKATSEAKIHQIKQTV